MKLDCAHASTERGPITRTFLDREFTIIGTFCTECRAVLWDEGSSAQFSQWLGKANFSRDRLSAQFFLSKSSLEMVEHVVEMFPGSDRSAVIRALVSVFMTVGLKDSDTSAKLEEVTKGEVFRNLTQSGREHRVSVQFKPLAMLDICDWANILDMSPSKFVEEATFRMVALVVEKDQRLHQIWVQKFRAYVELALKAA